MPLRTGIVAMALALAFAGAVFAFASLGGPVQTAAVKASTDNIPGPLKRSDPGVDPWKEPTVAPPKSQESSTERAEPRPEPAPEPAVEVAYEPPPVPELPTKPAPVQENPTPYELPDGAIMALTVDALGLREIPVFDSTGARALKYGVGHPPETSLPWTDSPHKNVYIAGHRLGFPGTASDRVFGSLENLGKGDEVILRGEGGKKYRYGVTDSFVASPEDSWVMARVRNEDMLTLQTCIGPNFSERLIVRAERI